TSMDISGPACRCLKGRTCRAACGAAQPTISGRPTLTASFTTTALHGRARFPCLRVLSTPVSPSGAWHAMPSGRPRETARRSFASTGTLGRKRSSTVALTLYRVWAVGEHDTIVHYDGTMWLPQTSPAPYPTWIDVWGRSKDDVWATGEGGQLRHF